MQVISAVVTRQDLRGVAWVAHDGIEIKNSIKCLPGANPGVDFLTHGFFFRSVKGERRVLEESVFERQHRRPDHTNSFAMRALDELSITSDQTCGADHLALRR